MSKHVPSAKYQLALSLAWPDIERIRVSVEQLIAALSGDQQVSEAVSMVSAELLENAVKHTSSPGGVVDYRLEVDEKDIHLWVDNDVSPEEDRTKRLADVIQWVAGFENPYDAYVQRMQQIFDVENEQESGLGLVRAAYEGHCRLSYELRPEQNRVRVEARFAA